MEMKLAANYNVSGEMLLLCSSIMERVGALSSDGTLAQLRIKYGGSSPYPSNKDRAEFERLYSEAHEGKLPSKNVRKFYAFCKAKKDQNSPLLLSAILAYGCIAGAPLEDEEVSLGIASSRKLLTDFREIFAYMPLDEAYNAKLGEHVSALRECSEKQDLSPYILFFLGVINDAFKLASAAITGFESEKSPCVRKLLEVMRIGIKYSSKDLMEKLGLKSRVAVKRNYLEPALKDGYVKMLLPSKPHSPNQRYLKTPVKELKK